MTSKVLLITVTVLFVSSVSSAKQTVGLFLNEEEASEGYTLFAPAYWYETYLINNEGLKVNSWESTYIPGLGGVAYLSLDGSLYRSIWLGAHPVLNTGGGTGGIQKFDWDGNLVWEFEYSGDNYRSHHDIEVLPSGNVLMIAWEIKNNWEAIQAGADQSKLGGRSLYPDHIIEVEPVGSDSGNIVWEWHTWDHLIQDYDSTKSNYGRVSTHPELIDINARNGLVSDFIHINSVKYNAELDQIIFTTPMYNEVWIIDHSTTTEEARGHTGGNSGKGGDILYRWGNPRFYDNGYANDQKLFGGHDANWVDPAYPGAGNIIIFNNGSGRNYSSVDEIVPPVDEEGNYTGGLPWGPSEAVWTYTAPDPEDFFVSYICGAQRLANGNTLVCDAPAGDFFEVTPEGDMVWRYISPVSDSGPVFQGDSISNNSVFKIRRYAPDFPGFEGKDMAPGKPVERYTDDTIEVVTEIEPPVNIELEVDPVITAYSVGITYHLSAAGHIRISLYNALGQKVKSLVDEISAAGNHTIIWDRTDNAGQKLNSGVYFCRLQYGKEGIIRSIRLLK